MEEISFPEFQEEVAEPALNYWRPVPKPPPVVLPPFTPNCIGNVSENVGWSCPTPTYNQPEFLPPNYVYHQTPYPLTDVIHSYIQNQQIGLSPRGITYEGERRRMPQCSLINADHMLHTLSMNPNYEQDSQIMTDSMIHDEVTRAAKTLFSKRNRTLLHWLKPDINKNQIKIDVNAAWDSLAASEKVFYISQVLGKFSPHSTSLMVNPQLEPSSIETSGMCMNSDKSVVRESKKSSGNKARPRVKKSQTKNKTDIDLQNIKKENKSEEEDHCDSGLVNNVNRVAPKEVNNAGAKKEQRVKRKYTKRKRKEGNLEQNVVANSSNASPFPAVVKNIEVEPGSEFSVDVKNIKVEPGSEFPVDVKNIKVEPGTEFPVDVKNIKVEPGTELPVNVKDIKMEPNNKVDITSNPLPRPKRKYVKRKLVRKKYKRREPKQKPTIKTTVPSQEAKSSEIVPEVKNEVEEMEMDLWIELANDSILTNEEVDNFFDSIEDPDSLFRELGIIEN